MLMLEQLDQPINLQETLSKEIVYRCSGFKDCYCNAQRKEEEITVKSFALNPPPAAADAIAQGGTARTPTVGALVSLNFDSLIFAFFFKLLHYYIYFLIGSYKITSWDAKCFASQRNSVQKEKITLL